MIKHTGIIREVFFPDNVIEWEDKIAYLFSHSIDIYNIDWENKVFYSDEVIEYKDRWFIICDLKKDLYDNDNGIGVSLSLNENDDGSYEYEAVQYTGNDMGYLRYLCKLIIEKEDQQRFELFEEKENFIFRLHNLFSVVQNSSIPLSDSDIKHAEEEIRDFKKDLNAWYAQVHKLLRGE